MRLNKILYAAAAVLCAAAMTCIHAAACTGVYVGKGASADGSVILCRTEDMSSSGSKRFIVHNSGEHKAGTSYTDAFGLTIAYSRDSYRYSAVPGSLYKGVGDAPYGAAGFNELGIAATATITAYPNQKAEEADPFVYTGVHELSLTDLILSQADSARGGIELAAEYVDKYGCGEGSIVMTADKDEAWYMEIYTGHQYAAVKLPEDKAAVMANAFMLGEIDTASPEVIVSKDIKQLPEKAGFLKKTNGRINLRETYGESEKLSNSLRIWGGRKLMHGTIPENPEDISYDLTFTPSQKINLSEVMELTRYRYEDTPYNTNLEENRFLRAIGTPRQEECHILQIRPNMSAATGCLEWLCMSSAEFAPYIPYYGASITDTAEVSKADHPEYDSGSMYWANRSLNMLCAFNRDAFGRGVRDFYADYQQKLINYLRSSDQLMAVSGAKSETANEICLLLTNDAYAKAAEIYRKLFTFAAEYEGKAEFDGNDAVFNVDISSDIAVQ